MSEPAFVYEPQASRSFAQEVKDRSGQNLFACYQCRRCAAGCPVGDETGVTPDRLIRMILLGERDTALNNNLVWQCVSCYTCGARCPNDIQTARINETLKQMAKEKGKEPLHPKVANFHASFVESAIRWGKVNEFEFMGFYELRNTLDNVKKGDFKDIINEVLSQMKFGLPMLTKKRVHFGFMTSKGRKELKALKKKSKQKAPAKG